MVTSVQIPSMLVYDSEEAGKTSRLGSVYIPAWKQKLRLVIADCRSCRLAVLPDILKELPALHADESVMYDFNSLPRLDPDAYPRNKDPAAVQVVNENTNNTAQKEAARQNRRETELNLASHSMRTPLPHAQ